MRIRQAIFIREDYQMVQMFYMPIKVIFGPGQHQSTGSGSKNVRSSSDDCYLSRYP